MISDGEYFRSTTALIIFDGALDSSSIRLKKTAFPIRFEAQWQPIESSMAAY
jgi:hypothetical protein